MMTPELFSDRGVAWIKAAFDICKVMIDDFGILALAIMAVIQNVSAKAHDIEMRGVKERLDRQGERIQANSEAVTAVALAATPPTP